MKAALKIGLVIIAVVGRVGKPQTRSSGQGGSSLSSQTLNVALGDSNTQNAIYSIVSSDQLTQKPPHNSGPGGPGGSAPPPAINLQTQPSRAASATNANSTPSQAQSYGSNSSERFSEDIAVVTNPQLRGYQPPDSFDSHTCSPTGDVIIAMHWNGGTSQTRLGKSGKYCFTLDNVNLILYEYTLTGAVPSPQQTPLDLLKDAVSSVSGLLSGGGSTVTKSGGPVPTPSGTTCNVSTDDAATAASQLSQALNALAPGKDSNGKPNTRVTYATSRNILDTSVTPAFKVLESSIGSLITAMGTQWHVDNCDDTFAKAEALIEGYVRARGEYVKLEGRASAQQVAEFEQNLENFEPFVITVVETSGGTPTNAGTQTYNFAPLYSLVTSSGGFMITKIQSLSYASGTAPSTTSPTTSTQNELVVNGRGGARPTVDALINVNLPGLNARNYGLGLSIGPVYDISNGKADTSNLGVFGGVSLRLTDYLYLTPGFHLGQFAGFPVGFTQAGQIIPPNTGTPNPTKRYTARFGFSITFKLKDIYTPKAATPTSAAPSGTPSGKSIKTSATPKPQ